jgi:hypothetical protein
MKRKPKILICVIAVIVVVLAVVQVAAIVRARTRGNIHGCWEYMNLISSAKEQVVLTRGLTNGQDVTWFDLDKVMMRGAPRECHAGGSLTPGTVGKLPSCSKHGELTETPIDFERR